MTAAYLAEFGPPEVLGIREVAAPTIRHPHDLLVRVRATSVNFGDTLVRNFASVTPRTFHMPWLFWLIGRATFGFRHPRVHILGSEFAGTVEAVGRGVTRFRPGDAVFGYSGPRMGAYAEYVCVRDASVVAHKPAHVSWEEAAGCPYGALMALGVLRQAGVTRGQHVLVVGASGGIGPPLVQIATRQLGATVTGVCGTARLPFVRSLGAADVIDYTRDDFLTRGGTYDVVIDVLGTSDVARCRTLLRPSGRLVYVSFKTRHLAWMLRTAFTRGPRVVCALVNERQTDLEAIAALLEAGTLQPRVDRTFPLAAAGDAHRHAERGKPMGAVVITVAARAGG
ncbi:MAG: NAD(P)-dependent alcohol dehydrogenase [Acidobacteria bacterium]|nr:NAD(P)-dependent alcohol dehydrogenase [Acidobacteriota bacterium]